MLRIEMLDAAEGDALWVEFGNGAERHRLLIDAGRRHTYELLAERLARPGPPLELLVVTHVDDDHIFGAVPLLADSRSQGRFRDVWFNGYRHLRRPAGAAPAPRSTPGDLLGPLNGEFFGALLAEHGHPWNADFAGGAVVVPDQGALPEKDVAGMKITLLTPSWDGLEKLRPVWEEKLKGLPPGDPERALERFADTPRMQPDDLLGGDDGRAEVETLLSRRFVSDTTEPNGSSIAFLAEYGGHAALFAADAHPPLLERSLRRLLASRGQERLRLDAFKVSHHGSRANTSPELLDLIDCPRFLFSTNGARHHHPDGEAIARILHRNRTRREPTELFFNFATPETQAWNDPGRRRQWNYQAWYPPQGAVVELGP